MNLDSSCQSSSYGNWIQLKCGERKGRGLLKERKRARGQRHKEKRRQNPQGDTVACLTIQKLQLRMSCKTSQVWKRSALPPKRTGLCKVKLKQLHKFTWGPGWLVVKQKEFMNLARQVCFSTLKEELTNRNDPHDRERGWRKRPFSALKHRNRVRLQSFPFIAHSDTGHVVLDSCCLALMRCEGWVCTSCMYLHLCTRRQLGHAVTVLLIAKMNEQSKGR